MEQIRNEMKMEFLALSSNEGFARVTVGAFVAELNPTVDELADIKTAVSEAVTNCIIHGYEQKGGSIWIQCSIEGQQVEISVVDTGKGIRDIEQARSLCLLLSRNWKGPVWGLHLWKHLWTRWK